MKVNMPIGSISILIGGACAMVSMLILRLWKKIKFTGLGSMGMILIFIPQALGLNGENALSTAGVSLFFSMIGAILLSIECFNLGKRFSE